MPSKHYWYAVHTRPNGENRAAFHLKLQGFESYAPCLRKTVRHARRSKSIMTPCFSRYIFVSLNLDRDRWRSVNGTFGVAYLLMVNDRPVHVPEGFVENLMNSLDGTEPFDIGNKLQINKNARFRDGPFSELICQVQSIDAKGRVKVLLELMGRPVPVMTRPSNLTAAI